MELAALDWILIAGYLALTVAIGFAFRKRAGKSAADFFVSGRSLPWWIAGTSMVATTFAADTPLAVTGLVAKNGLAGNWVWWSFAMGGMLTVFVFARLWRRAGVMTDVELIGLRYGGAPARWLRGFRALYVALLLNAIIIGWVTKAMVTILDQTVLHGLEPDPLRLLLLIGGLLLLVGIYSTMAGMWGVAVADVVQFALAMGGCIALAVVAVDAVGGTDALREKVAASFGDEQAFSFLPDFGAADPWMPLWAFLAMVCVQWWATWYPGAEPGGGGYIVQRMAACKNEEHAVKATLWFQLAHYCLRPWPWIMVAFCALALHPEIREWALFDRDLPKPHPPKPDIGYAMLIRELAPAGLLGLLLVTFGAAFMSTISTQMNWGASYLVNDLYMPFVNPQAEGRKQARAARLASCFVLLGGGVAAYLMLPISIDEAWKFMLALGAGIGPVLMLRWFWWRINVWSEISAMVAAPLLYTALTLSLPEKMAHRDTEIMLWVALGTIATWLSATFLTRPESRDTLGAFYRKVHPAGPGWRPVAAQAPDVTPDRDLGRCLFAALLGSAVVYFALPGIGAVIFGDWGVAAITLTGALVCGALLLRLRPAVR